LKARADLLSIGFKTSPLDPCVYIKERKGQSPILIGLFVDDFFLLCEDDAERKDIFNRLSKEFELQDLGWLRSCLGIRFTQNKGITKMDQTEYIEETIIGEHQFDKIKHFVATPFIGQPLTPLDEEITTEDGDPMSLKEYQEICGKLIWVSDQTRPDISFSVHQACRFLKNPGPEHKEKLRRIVRYLAGTKNLGIFFRAVDLDAKAGPKIEEFQLSAFADADWGNDKVSRKSVSGWIIFLAGGPVAWGCSMQGCIAQSTTEAEYVALNQCLKDVVWFRQILDFMGYPQTTTAVMDDNSGCINWSEGRMNHKRSKHVELKYHWNQRVVALKLAKLHFVRTHDMIADILTKGTFAKRQFRKLRSLLMNYPLVDQFVV
jgi:hypothetical protein